MKKVIEINLQLDAAKVSGKNDSEIKKFMEETVNPFLITCLSERSRGGEVGCSVGSDGKGECHGTIRW